MYNVGYYEDVKIVWKYVRLFRSENKQALMAEEKLPLQNFLRLFAIKSLRNEEWCGKKTRRYG